MARMRSRRLTVQRFPARRPEFNPRSRNVGFMVDEVPVGQVLSEKFSFLRQFSFYRMLHMYLSSGAGTICTVSPGRTEWTQSLGVEPEGSTKQIPKLQTSDAILNQLLTTSKHIPPKAILMLAYHLLLGLLSDCFPRGLFTELLHEFSVPPIRATRSTTG